MGTDFDEATSKRLEAMYQTRAMVERRLLVRQSLRAVAGEAVLDLGCGPGLYARDLLEDVGPTGEVRGVDASDDMLALARQRCRDHPNAQFDVGDAAAIPAASGAFDAVISVQVLEYVPDTSAVLAEMFRVLNAGGRVLVWATDWSTLSWHSSDDARMQRVLDAWDDHLAHRSLPRVLAPALQRAGFENVTFSAHSAASSDASPDTHGGTLLRLVPAFVAGHGGIPADELGSWVADQRDLADRGQFFCAVTQFCFTGRRPDAPNNS
jgi:ubiquinone/menaquinone biosynthesis C-methylase UbiE